MDESLENRAGPLPDPPRTGGFGRVLLDAVAKAILNAILFVFRFFWWSLRWSLATVFFVGVMAGTGYYVFEQAAAGGAYVAVPDITGLSIMEASYRLEDAGLAIGRQTEIVSEQVPRYHVIAQRPAAGKTVQAGRKVYPTVSVGADLQKTPMLVGQNLDDARAVLARSRLKEGALARLPNSAARDTVIAQEPPAEQNLLREAAVNLLLSAGPPSRSSLMPDLLGKTLQEAMAILAPLPVKAIANRVERPDQPLDVILDQQPAAGTEIQDGQTISYDVRVSGSISPPALRRKTEVRYTVPHAWSSREVRVDQIDRNGVRLTRYPLPEHYVDGQPPKLEPGTPLTITVAFQDELTIEVYLDGRKARTYYFQGDAEPVITDFPAEGENSGTG